MASFDSFNLSASINSAIKLKGYDNPTPIQEECIPHLLSGVDLLGIAQTGTGKTAAFSLPILHMFGEKKKSMEAKRVRALILTPTRELATQIDSNIQYYGQGLDLKTKTAFGGVGKQPQVDALAHGLDILVATPGRLLDLMRSEHVLFDQLEVFVLDEADTMLDMGFLNDVNTVIDSLPTSKQTLLFSATMPPAIEKLATSLLNNPVKVETTPESSTLDLIDQKVFFIEKTNKYYLLLNILQDESIKSLLIFCKSKFGVDRIVEQLERVPFSVGAIHSGKSQTDREQALQEFRDGKIRILVATDVAARGIDVPQISHVINLNLPEDPRNYIHRIGRTARAGRSGVAISICVQSEMPLLRSVEKLLGKKIPVDISQAFHKEFYSEEGNNKKVKKKNQLRKNDVNLIIS